VPKTLYIALNAQQFAALYPNNMSNTPRFTMHGTLSRVFFYIAFFVSTALGWPLSIGVRPDDCAIVYAMSGGTPPYTITFLHTPDLPQNAAANLSLWGSAGAGISLDFSGASPSGFTSSPDVMYTPMVVVGSDATGFGTGGTSEAFTVQIPSYPNCSMQPPTNNTDYLSFVQSFSTNIIECGNVTAQLNASFPGGNPDGMYVDTIVPLGQSYRTFVNTLATNGTVSWPVTVSAGTNILFAFSVALPGTGGPFFVTPLLTVQRGNASCQTTGTISGTLTALPTETQAPSASAGERRSVGRALLAAVATIASVAMVVGLLGL